MCKNLPILMHAGLRASCALDLDLYHQNKLLNSLSNSKIDTQMACCCVQQCTSWSDLIITKCRLAQWFFKDSLLFEFQSIQNSNHLNNMASPFSLSQLECVTPFSYYRLQEAKDYMAVKLTLELLIIARSVIPLDIKSDNDNSKSINVIFLFYTIPEDGVLIIVLISLCIITGGASGLNINTGEVSQFSDIYY